MLHQEHVDRAWDQNAREQFQQDAPYSRDHAAAEVLLGQHEWHLQHHEWNRQHHRPNSSPVLRCTAHLGVILLETIGTLQRRPRSTQTWGCQAGETTDIYTWHQGLLG